MRFGSPRNSNPGPYLNCIRQAINSAIIYKGTDLRSLWAKKNAWKAVVKIFKLAWRHKRKIMFIGNGGSAAIAGHMSLDFSNAGKIRAVCFNDGPLLTCLANDYSYQKVFEKAVGMYADSGDVLVAISSSGQSENILNGVISAKQKGCTVITLSGFERENPLMKLGDWNIYVPLPRPNYGQVEVSHYIILHFLLDYITKNPVLRERSRHVV